MPPTFGYDPIGTAQQAITALLLNHEPEFICIGTRMFLSFGTIMLSWHGVRMMLAWRQAGEHMFSFAQLLLMVSFRLRDDRLLRVADPGRRDLLTRTSSLTRAAISPA